LVVRFAEDSYAQARGRDNQREDSSEPAVTGSDVASSSPCEHDEPPPLKKPKLFKNYTQVRERNTSTPDECTIEELLAKYLRTEHGDSSDSDAFGFWMQRETESKYGKLLPAVLRAFAIPASSAPVERVFSHGGIMLRPNRARMSDKLLSELVFLKCNAL